MGRCLLVSHQNVLKIILIENSVVNVQHCAARVTEHMFYPLFGQTPYNDLCAIEFHRLIPFITCTSTTTCPKDTDFYRLQQHATALHGSRNQFARAPCCDGLHLSK